MAHQSTDFRALHTPLLMQLATHKTMLGQIPPTALPGILAGIQRYARAAVTLPTTAMTPVWQNGPVRLLHLPGTARQNTPVFIVPSIINTARIFDLMPGRSFVHWLHTQIGCDVYVLDWGDLTRATTPPATSDDLLLLHLTPALTALPRPPHVLGYCLGGVFALLAGLTTARAASLTLLATPYDTQQTGDDIAPHIRGWASLLDTLLYTNPDVPAGWLYSFFAALPQANTPEKFATIANLADSDPALHHFLAVEDWTQYAPPVPGALLRHCLHLLYHDNALSGMHLCGNGLPVHIIAPARDRIVPPVATIGLHTAIPGSTLFQPDCGHVGAMAGRAGPDLVWPAMHAFWNSCAAA